MQFVFFGVESAFRRVRTPLVMSLVAALAAGGCAESRSRYAAADHVRAAPPQVAQSQPAELEEDGLPAQVPPLRRPNPLPDDPNEPYSPNYGSPPMQKRADAAIRVAR